MSKPKRQIYQIPMTTGEWASVIDAVGYYVSQPGNENAEFSAVVSKICREWLKSQEAMRNVEEE